MPINRMSVVYGSDVSRVVTVRRNRQTHENQNAFVRQEKRFVLRKPKQKLNNKAEAEEQGTKKGWNKRRL